MGRVREEVRAELDRAREEARASLAQVRQLQHQLVLLTRERQTLLAMQVRLVVTGSSLQCNVAASCGVRAARDPEGEGPADCEAGAAAGGAGHCAAGTLY